jgi:hypothetical protein
LARELPPAVWQRLLQPRPRRRLQKQSLVGAPSQPFHPEQRAVGQGDFRPGRAGGEENSAQTRNRHRDDDEEREDEQKPAHGDTAILPESSTA